MPCASGAAISRTLLTVSTQLGTLSAQVVPEVFQLYGAANLGTERQFSCFDKIVRRVILSCLTLVLPKRQRSGR
jgi:hypothetical protein